MIKISKQSWKPGTLVYPVPAVLVSCGVGKKDNILTVAWTGTICTDPAMTYISLRKERFSYDIIKNTREFTINLTTKDLVYATDYAGVRSGKNEDKIAKLGLHLKPGTNNYSKIIEESPINIECEVVQINELGSHDMFIAKVKNIYVDERYIDNKGAFDMKQCGLIAYMHGKYYELGNEVGKFGFSVKKK